MVDLNERVIEEAVHEGESMLLRELFDLVERGHDGRAGVSHEALSAYARRLADRDDFDLDADGLLDEIDDRTTASETWAGYDRFYELGDGRLSQYPTLWHDHLGGSDDVAAYLRFVRDEQPAFVDDLDHGGAGDGVPEDTLVHVLMVVGRLDQGAATRVIEDARDRDVVAEDLDQHPQANVALTDRGRDGSDTGT